MEVNYHQVVANMKPEVFKICQGLSDLWKQISSARIDRVPGTTEELALLDIEEALDTLRDSIEKDPDNWIPVPPQDNKGTVTSSNGKSEIYGTK